MRRFENKVVFITGATSGIGKAAAVLFAREGAQVMVADIKEDQAAIDEIRQEGGEVRFIACDVSRSEQVEQAVAATVTAFGSLDIAVNNAGISDRGGSLLHEKSNEEWQQVQDINLSGVFYGLKFQIAQMRKQQSGGSIVNIGSIMSAVANETIASYVSAKHGVVGLTKVAALENAQHNIRVNTIGPGYIATPILPNQDNKELRAYMESLHPMNRLGLPEEIAKPILFLASEEASFCTGVYLPVDGGYLIK
jgi:NAD(P)-dependent dehydrogenase (short-subunit alcohol dehydrogenase family)